MLQLLVVGASLVAGVLVGMRLAARATRHADDRSSELFARAVAGSPSAMSLSRLDDTTVVEANQAYLEMFGVRRGDLIGRTPADIGLQMGESARDAAFEALRERGAFVIPALSIRTPAGVERTAGTSSQVLEIGGVKYVLTTFVDLTDRARAEAAAERSEAMFRELAESIHEVFWLADAEHTKMHYVSPAYEAMFGRTRAAIYADARDWMRDIHRDDRERMHTFVTTPITERQTTDMRICNADGVRTIGIEVIPIRDERGTVVRIAGMAADITEQLALEEQVRQTQKLESLGLLAGGVAHDFNNILAVIGANSGLLETSVHTDEDREILGEIQHAVTRASALTRQLLAFSRKQVVEPIVLDLNAAIADTRKMLRRMVGEDIVITTSLEPELGRVRIDPGHVVQVLMNLAVNARDAMVQGGTLTLSTRNLGADVVVSIADTGCGMSAETKARAFEPLFTTKGVGKGTGLGLSVVHGIVQAACGRIEVDSEPGIGTTFRIYLPVVDAPVERIENVASAGASGNERIVFVDDDHYVRTAASRALRSRGYTVLEASDAQAALALIHDHETIDLLVTDIVMPGMDGRQLAEAARKERPQLRVLYTSGYADDAVLRHGVSQAQVAFLEKPFRVHMLAGKVRTVLDAAA